MTFNFDFNHGGTRPADDPRSRDVSERVNDFVDAAFFAKRAAEPARNYVGASAIGHDCLRAVQFSYAKVPIDDGRITGRSLRIFRIGHVFEDEVANWLCMGGFALDVLDPETGHQFGFSLLDDAGQGHLDGILRSGPVPLGYPALWECKALNNEGWQLVKKHGLAIAKPLYAAQIAINQAYLALHEHPAIFTALNKNTEELHHELVPFDQPLAQEMSDRMAHVIRSTRDKQLLPRGFASQDNFKCKFCDHHKTCWSLPR